MLEFLDKKISTIFDKGGREGVNEKILRLGHITAKRPFPKGLFVLK